MLKICPIHIVVNLNYEEWNSAMYYKVRSRGYLTLHQQITM